MKIFKPCCPCWRWCPGKLVGCSPTSTKAAGVADSIRTSLDHAGLKDVSASQDRDTGATVVMGGKRIDRPGALMQPTILTDIKLDNPAFREEFFGPIALFFEVKNEDEAVVLANDSDFGLGDSVFTKDVAEEPALHTKSIEGVSTL